MGDNDTPEDSMQMGDNYRVSHCTRQGRQMGDDDIMHQGPTEYVETYPPNPIFTAQHPPRPDGGKPGEGKRRAPSGEIVR